MKLYVTLSACCLNCRHYDKDERTMYRYMRQGRKDKPPVFCPEEGIKYEICDKFVPRKRDVQHAIWKAKNVANAALTNWLDGSRRSLLAARHVGEAALIRRARCATGGQGSERSERRNPARAARRIAQGDSLPPQEENHGH